MDNDQFDQGFQRMLEDTNKRARVRTPAPFQLPQHGSEPVDGCVSENRSIWLAEQPDNLDG